MPFSSCFEPLHESEPKCKVFMKQIISFHSYTNETNFHMKSFVQQLVNGLSFFITSQVLPFVDNSFPKLWCLALPTVYLRFVFVRCYRGFNLSRPDFVRFPHTGG